MSQTLPNVLSLSLGCATKFCGEQATCRSDGATGTCEDNLTFYCSIHAVLSSILRFYISLAGPNLGIAIQGDGKKEKREMASPVGTEKASNKLIYDSSQLIYLHPPTFLPGLLSSSPLLIVLRDGVWG